MMRNERRVEIAAFTAILILAIFLRFYQLDARPLHHDESVHAWFSYYLNLNTYTYDPTYHGPFQFYIARAIFSILGASDFTVRLLPAFFGILLVALAYPLRKQLGRAGYLTLAFFLAISPSMLYYSRFFRNDIYMVVFSLVMVICALRFVENQRAIYLYIAAIAVALSFAAKENAIITMFIFLSFALLYLLNEKYDLRSKANLILFGRTEGIGRQNAYPRFALLLRKNIRVIVIALLIAIAIYSVLLSNFFQRIDNLLGLESSDPAMRLPAPLRGIATWMTTHGVGRISGPFFYYVPFLFIYELPIVLFAIAGSIHYLRKKDTFMIFAVYWAIASLLMYSYIQEKVPWLVLHILLPQCIIAAGYIGEKIEGSSTSKFSPYSSTFLLILMAFFIYSSLNLNYVNSYNPQEPLVYVQTSGDVKLIMNQIESISNNTRYKPIAITTSDYWPFPWYLREYTDVRYGRNYYDASFVISSDLEAGEIEKELSGKGFVRQDFNLRIWHVFEPRDVTMDFLLFRKVAVPNGALKLAFFYKPGERR